MIFSPSTGAYKQVGGFKAIFDIFQAQYQPTWPSVPIARMFLLYEIISGKNQVINSRE
jgi:hypothetical protein